MKNMILPLFLLLTLSTNALSWNVTTKKSDMLGNENAIMVIPVNNGKSIGFRCKDEKLSLTFFILDQRTVLKNNLYSAVVFKIDDVKFRMPGEFSRQNVLSIGITNHDHDGLISMLKLLKNKPKEFYVFEEMEYSYLPHKIGLSDPVSSINKFSKLCGIAF